MSWNFAKYPFISSLIVCILSVAAMENSLEDIPLDPNKENTQPPPQKANPIKEAIMKLIQNSEFLPDEHDIDYYTQTIKESLKSNITPEDVYQAFKDLRADISTKSADITEEDPNSPKYSKPNSPKYSKEVADISKANRAKNRELSKKINTWLNQNQPNQRLRKVVDTMYQDHVVTAEYFNDKPQQKTWYMLMGAIFDKTFQNSICEVHYLNLDTKEFHIDDAKPWLQGKNYKFEQFKLDQFPGVDSNRIISLVIWRPANGNEKVPVGIFNHGGGANNIFYPGQSNPIMTALGGLGYAIVAPNYRNGSLKEHLEDMQATTEYLQGLEFVDKNKIVLTGISTGTLLNSLVIDQVGSKLAGVFLHTGFYGSPSPSPFDHLMNIPPNLPIFLASGAKDSYDSARPNWVIKYIRALQDVSSNVSFFLLEQGGHQLIELIHPEITPSVLSGNANVNFANLKKIIKESEKRYNADEMMDYISHFVEFLDKIAHGEIPSPVHSKPDPAYQYKKIGIGKWERAQEPRQELTNEEINRQKEQVAKPIIGKAQAAQSIKGIKTPETMIQAYFQPPIDLLPKNPLLKSALYTLSLAQLKVLLEDEYDENDLEKNVTRFLEKYDTEKKSIGARFIKANQLKTKIREEQLRKRLREDTADNKEYNCIPSIS